MRRLQPHSRSFWIALAGAGLIVVLSTLQITETVRRAGQRIGIDIDEESSRLHIAKLEPGGPAERAGFRVGDRLVTLDGTRLAAIEDFDRTAGAFRRGQPVTVRIERAADALAVQLVPGMPAPWWNCLGKISVAMLCLLVGFLALAARSGDLRARLLAAVFFLTAIEFSVPLGVGIDAFWTRAGPVLFYVLTGTQFALELHLAAVLPRPDAWPGRRRLFIAACHLSGLSIAAIGTLTYLVESTGAGRLPWSLDRVDETIHRLVLPAWAIGMLALLVHAAARAPTRKGRLQSALVLLGVLPWALYIVSGWASGDPYRLLSLAGGVLIPLLMLCYPIAVFVAISRFQLFDLEFVVRRSLAYATLTSVLVGLFYATLGAGGALFSSLVQPGPRPLWSFAAASVVLGLAFAPLRRGIQCWIDRRFFPEREAMRRRLIELAGELTALGDSRRMGDHLTRELCSIFRTGFARILWVDPIDGTLSRLASSEASGSDVQGAPGLHVDDPWIAKLRRAGRPVIVSHREAAWPRSIRQPQSPRIAVPLIAQRRLVAVLFLGEKYGGLRYSREELELLGLLAHHLAVAFDNVRLFRSATYEGLTGLFRREAALEMLDREIDRTRRHGRPLTVALADIDHFKRINDRFGHLHGDNVLRRVAGELSARTRSTDGVGRYGGEEFLLVFPETELGKGARLAEELRLSIERMELADDEGRPIPVRISIGVAGLRDSNLSGPDTIPELLAAADRRLYRAKQAGRNRVEPRPDADDDHAYATQPIFSSAG